MSQQRPPQTQEPYEGERYSGPVGQDDSGSPNFQSSSADWTPSYPPEAYLPGRPLPLGLPGMAAPPSQYRQEPSQPWSGYDAPPPNIPPYEPEPARGWVVPLLVMLIIALVLVSGGAVFALTRDGATVASSAPATTTATEAPTATPTPLSLPAGFNIYIDPANNFRLFVPNGWQTQPGTPLVSFLSESDLAEMSVGYETPASVLLDDDLNATLSQIVTTQGGSLANRQGPVDTTLGGEHGAEVYGDWTKDGFSFHIVLIGANHNDGTGLVAYLAPQNSFTGTDDRFFSTMVQSFTFLH